MPIGTIGGAIAGLVIGWIIAASRSKFTYAGGGYGRFEGMSAAATLGLYVILAIIGAVVGTTLFEN